ncbi:CgeB family protein [Paenibacillus methanolicus]|uniref:Spore maturation protein CgeB n=1 Tax=Paenibacillus methanolicus TaxID=582686 RepID=A0A5S5CID5_9BACL|nr:glycosyltransferase [Paenibacillus methanolicus]TYP79482.1 spore maturation protein CgeB [Paenibacillus methanolicus]
MDLRILFLNWAPIISFGLAPGFRDIGWVTDILPPEDNHPDGIRRRIADFKPDYLLTEGGVGREKLLLPLIEECGVPHLYWAIEDPVASNLSLAYGRASILTLTTCEEWLREVYAPNGVEAICVPFACNPSFHATGRYRPEFRHELAFVGNNYEAHANRKAGLAIMIDPLLAAGYPIAFYGDENWINGRISYTIDPALYRGYLSYIHWPDLCASTPFVLGLHSINGSRTMQAMRSFEVLGCGGLFFTQHTTAMEAMFDNHKHLVWSTSAEETVELYRYYQSHPDEAERIRRQGREFVYAHHTYAHRAREIEAKLAQLHGKQVNGR